MSGTDSIRVAIRVRPLIKREHDANTQTTKIWWRVEGNTVLQLTNSGKAVSNAAYTFDKVFSQRNTTQHVFDEFAKPVVLSAMAGFNGTIFAYGQTSSGKTHTMMGNDRCPGVIPQAADEIFQYIEQWPTREFLLRVSYMEIYNEVISDLLKPGNKNLKIHETVEKQVYVGDLTEELVTTKEQILSFMAHGERHRHFGETNMNDRSSRSHTIFRMVIESREMQAAGLDPDSIDGAVRVSHLNLVDLAGSERVATTGAEGVRLKEGGHINRSLFTLGSVISKLSEGESFIPFRDSKLTRILQSSLGGNAKTSILCTVTPASIEETTSTLRFASRAKTIKNCPEVNEVLDDGTLLKRYRKEIRELKRQLEQSGVQELQSEKEKMAQILEEKNKLQRDQEEKIKKLADMICHSGAVQQQSSLPKLSKRRETWCPGRTKFMAPLLPREAEVASVKNRLQRLSSSSSSGDSLCSFEEMPKEQFLAELEEEEELASRVDNDRVSPLLTRVNVHSMPETSQTKEIKTERDRRLKALEAENQQLKVALENALKENELELHRRLMPMKQENEELKVALEDAIQEKEMLDDLLSKSNAHLQKVLMGPTQSESTNSLDACQKKLAELESTSRKREAELEEEKRQLVETAKEFAMEHERQFAEKIKQLEESLSRKNEQLQEAEAELTQINYSLLTVQREKDALLEASEERDREFETERRQWRNSLVAADEKHVEKEEQLNLRVKSLETDIADAREKLNEYEARVVELEDSKANAGESQNHGKDEKGTQFDGFINLETQLVETREDLKKSEKRVAELEASLEAEKDKEKKGREDSQAQQRLLDNLQVQLCEIEQRYKQSEERVTELESLQASVLDTVKKEEAIVVSEQEKELVVVQDELELLEKRVDERELEKEDQDRDGDKTDRDDEEQDPGEIVANLERRLSETQEELRESEVEAAELESASTRQLEEDAQQADRDALVVVELETKLAEAQEQLKNFEEKVAKLTSSLAEKNEELLCSRAEYEVIKDKLDQEITEHTKAYEQLELTAKELRSAKEELEEKVAKLTSSLAEENEELLCGKAEYEVIRDKLDQEVTEHTKAYEQLELTAKELRSAKEELEEKVQEQEEALKAAAEQLKVTRQELKEKETASKGTVVHDSLSVTLQLEELKRVKEEISRELTEEQKAHQALRSEFAVAKEELEQAKKSLLRDTNRDMDQQRTIDLMMKERRESFLHQAHARQEVEKGRLDAEKKVSDLELQCKQLRSEKDRLEHRLDVATREQEKSRQDMRDLENLYSSHNSWSGPSSNNQGDKVTQKLKQLQFNLELTKQKCEKAEKRVKELESENRLLEGAERKNDCLIQERDAAWQQAKDAKETLSDKTKRLNDLGVQVTQLRAHLDQLTNENKKQKGQLEKNEHRIEALEQKLWIEQDKVKVTEKLQKETNKTHKDQVDELNATLAKLRQEFDELQVAKRSIEASLAEKEYELTKVRELGEDHSYLQEENMTLYEDVKEMEALQVKDKALIKELQADLQTEKQEKEALESQCKELAEASHKGDKRLIEDLRAELLAVQEQKSALENQSKEALESQRKELAEASQKEDTGSEDKHLIEDLRAELLAVQEQKVALENESKELSEELKQDILQLQDENIKWEEAYEDLQEYVSRGKACFEDLQVELSSSKEYIAELESKLAELPETTQQESAVLDELKTLQDSALSDRDVIERLQEELSSAKEEKEALETEIKQLSLSQDKLLLQEELQEAQQLQEQAGENIRRLEEEVTDAKLKNQELERRCNESCQGEKTETELLQKEIAGLKQQVQDINFEKQALEDLFEMSRKTEQELNEKTEMLESAMKELKVQMEETQQREAEKQQEVLEKEKIVCDLQVQLRDLQAKQEGQAADDVKELNIVISRKQDELDAVTQKLCVLEEEIRQAAVESQAVCDQKISQENERLREQHEADEREIIKAKKDADELYEKMSVETDRLKGMIDEQQDEIDEYTAKIKNLEAETRQLRADQTDACHVKEAVEERQRENERLREQHEREITKAKKDAEDKVFEEMSVETDRLKEIIDEQQDEIDEYTAKIKTLETETRQLKADQTDACHVKEAVEEKQRENERLREQHEREIIKAKKDAENKVFEEMSVETDRLKGIIDEQQDELEEYTRKLRSIEAEMSQKKAEETQMKQTLMAKELEETRLEMAGKNMKIQELQREVFNLEASLEDTQKKSERMLAHEQRKIQSLKQELRSQKNNQDTTMLQGSSNVSVDAGLGAVSTVAMYSMKANLGKMEETNKSLSEQLEQLRKDYRTLSMLKTEESNKVAKLNGENNLLRKEMKKAYEGRKSRKHESQADQALAPSNLPNTKRNWDESCASNEAEVTKISVAQKPSEPKARPTDIRSTWLRGDAADDMFKEEPNKCNTQ